MTKRKYYRNGKNVKKTYTSYIYSKQKLKQHVLSTGLFQNKYYTHIK